MGESKPSHIETTLVHAGQVPDPTTGARAVPIVMSSSYVFKNSEHAARIFALEVPGFIYSRLHNPTVDVAEQRLAAMEGGVGALLTASGMSAIFLAMHTIAGAGDHIVASASLYGGTDTLFRYTFPRMGIAVTFVDASDAAAVRAAIRPNTKAVYIETIGNPKGDVPDIQALADAAHAAGVPLMVDNTFGAVICRPFEAGADIIVHSCTKWISGHGTGIGGVIVDAGRFDWASGRFPDFTTPDPSYHGLVYAQALKEQAFIVKARVQGMRNIGMCPSAFNAFLFLQGMETLALRMERQCANTLALAVWLKQHPRVEWVNYVGLPEHGWHAQARRYLKGGFGAVFGFGIKGGRSAGAAFIDSVKLASHLANVGDAKTLVIHPASTTHAQLSEAQQQACGINPGFIRVAVGLEHIDDIQADFAQALAKSAN
jgi:O-acetylhomoserine (thiol)-lyase